MPRIVARNAVDVPVNGLHPLQPQGLVAAQQRALSAATQLPNHGPVEEPNAGLQAAVGVDAKARRVLLQPACQLGAQQLQKGVIGGECPGLGQRHPMQVPVQLPKVLDVAHLLAVADVQAALRQQG